jgi:hypothetical protein
MLELKYETQLRKKWEHGNCHSNWILEWLGIMLNELIFFIVVEMIMISTLTNNTTCNSIVGMASWSIQILGFVCTRLMIDYKLWLRMLSLEIL